METVAVTFADVDELLSTTASVDSSVSVLKIRAWRDELAHVAVLLAYARHVLSVDVGVLQSIAEDPERDVQAVVNDLPHLLATASIGGGWSLSPDSPATMRSAGQALEGEANGLLSAHGEIALVDFRSHEDITRAIEDLEAQLGMVTSRRDSVEKRLAELRGLLVEKYKSGDATIEDWIR